MILLSFDIEEFDMPLEYGKEISFENQIANESRSQKSRIKKTEEQTDSEQTGLIDLYDMGNLKKKRRLKMNKHKRRKRTKSNRHKKKDL